MTIYLASGNEHKREEFAQIFSNHSIILPQEVGIAFDPEETGSTFLDNALIKARALYSCVHLPVIADDSGLCIDALQGKPGIYSARYGSVNGTVLSAAEKNERILREMCGKTQRTCRFVCALVLLLAEDRFYCVQETFEGQITEHAQGMYGFGYDPIVYIPALQKTVAELTSEEKNQFSHRGKAGQKLVSFLEMPLNR
ncbi:MAG: RdgB/HAM1 family non-canonical purine NTP pyrophosphatase [Treponema sp.]